MRFKIPYYAQSAEFTCGPACVLMIFKFFNPRLKLNRTVEFEVWRQCNMIGVRGADPFGMSVPLLDAGYEVHLTTQCRRVIDIHPKGGKASVSIEMSSKRCLMMLEPGSA